AEKAAQAPTATLEALLPKYEQAGRLDVAVAIRGELLDRAQVAARPAVGTSTKVWGPTTDQEAFAVWRERNRSDAASLIVGPEPGHKGEPNDEIEHMHGRGAAGTVRGRHCVSAEVAGSASEGSREEPCSARRLYRLLGRAKER